jgi:cytosine/uracil/thiamine/allantoin permease
VAFIAGLFAGWSVEDGLVPALQGPISTKLLSGADLSWLVGIVVAGVLYLVLGRHEAPVAVPGAVRGGR